MPILHSHAEIRWDDERTIPVVTFGTVNVLPEAQHQGYGSMLIRFTLERSRARLWPSGDHRDGLRSPLRFCRRAFDTCFVRRDVPDEEASFFTVKQLCPGYLDGVAGNFFFRAGRLSGRRRQGRSIGFEISTKGAKEAAGATQWPERV